MISDTKRLCLALALALSSAAVSAAQSSTANQDQLRQELRDAQKQLAEIGRRVAELSVQIGDDPARVQMFRYLGNPDRAVIGVLLGEEGKEGVAINGVTPGGPAERAGLRTGDTITAIRGNKIAGERAGEAVRAALVDLKAGDKIAISYLRDGKPYSAEIAAARQGSSFGMLGGPNANGFVFQSDKGETIHFPPDLDPEMKARLKRAATDGNGLQLNLTGMPPLGGLRLTSLNEGLGRYFGVTEGALVLEVHAERYKGLQAGDVILKIDGRPVEDLRGYMREMTRTDPSRPVELTVQRDHVRQLVQISVWTIPPGFMAPPAPTALPTPPPSMPAPRAPTPLAAPHPSAAPAPPPTPPAQSAML